MTQSTLKAIPDGIHTITPHIVVRNAGRAAEWYKKAFGAEERSRIPVPDGKFMQIALWFGDSAVMIADEFPEAGVLSPQAIGGSPVVLHFSTENVEALWNRVIEAGAEVVQPLQDQFWVIAMDKSVTPLDTVGGLPSTFEMFLLMRSHVQQRHYLVVKDHRHNLSTRL